VSDIPKQILAESREMSKEVTPPAQLFFRTTRWRLRPGGDTRGAILRILSDETQTKKTGVTPNVPRHSSVHYDAPTAPNITHRSADRHHPDGRLASGDTSNHSRPMCTSTALEQQFGSPRVGFHMGMGAKSPHGTTDRKPKGSVVVRCDGRPRSKGSTTQHSTEPNN
jgi:hypothetical protein